MRQSMILILMALFSLFFVACDDDKSNNPGVKQCSGCEPYQYCDTTTGECKTSANYCDATTPCKDETKECDVAQNTCVTKADACKYLTCGGADAGTCNDSDPAKVVCDCKTGYSRTSDGLNCIADATKTAKCAEYACDDNGSCELNRSGDPVCVCKEGFQLDSSDPHKCVESNGGTAAAGDLGDPCDPKENLQDNDNTACRYGLCLSDGYCSKPCMEDNQCGSGYYCDKFLVDSQGECKKLDPACTDLRTKGAFEACCGDSACPMGTLCSGGQCMPICLGDSECSGYVKYENNVCGEKDGNTGGAEVYCSAAPGYYGFCEITERSCEEIKRSKGAFEACNSACGDADCMTGMRCISGKCMPSCDYDVTCESVNPDTYCYLGVLCFETPASCDKRSKKMWESCDPNCQDADCPEGATCSSNNVCAPICSVGDSCGAAKDDQYDAYCNAQPGYYGNCERFPKNLGCAGEKKVYEECEATCGDLDCGSGMICSGEEGKEICLPKCDGMDDTTTCSEGYTCSPVAGDFYCSKGVCWKGGDCPEGQGCTGLTGASLNGQDAIVAFCEATTATKNYGESCSGNDECISNFCLGGSCSKMCTGSDECTEENELCLLVNIQDDYDLPLCLKTDSADARPGLNDMAFTGMCDANGGCSAGSNCYPSLTRTVALSSDDIEYLCLGEAAPLTGDREVGKSCSSDAQCVTGVCWSRDKKCIEPKEVGADCMKSNECASAFCNTLMRKCEASNNLDLGDSCVDDVQCKSGRCDKNSEDAMVCMETRKAVGSDCCSDGECESGMCQNFTCAAYCDTNDNCPEGMSCKADGMYKYCQKTAKK